MAPRLASKLLIAIALAYGAVALATFPEWTVDDAFITYRYSENLARHGELTWNPGDDPVEGYTGVLLPVALAGAVAAGASADAASTAIGIVAYVAVVALLVAVLDAMGVGPVARGLAALVCATAPMLFTHATSGLETMLFAALALASLLAFARAVDATEGRGRAEAALAVLLLALCLTRPEGAVFAAVALALLGVVRARAGWRDLGTLVLRVALLLAIPGAIYFAWRYSYYGQLLPNTFYAKLHHRVSADSAIAAAKFAAIYLAFPAAAVFALAVAGPRDALAAFRARSLGARLGALAALLVTAIVTAQYLRSALIMNYAHRFWAPFYPLLLVAVTLAASAAWEALGRRRAATVALVVAGGLVVVQLVAHVALLPRERRFARDTARLLADEHVQVARFLREHVPAGGTIVVVVDAGAVPYFSGFRTIDFGGLNDEFLARRFRDRVPLRQIVDYFYSHDAEAVVFTSSEWDRIVGPEPAPIEKDPRFANYVLAARFRSDAFPSYFEHVYLRRDLAPAQPATP